MTSVVTAGGTSVTIRGVVVDESEAVLNRLVSDGVPRSLASGNAKLWGPDAAPEAARRLGWLRLPESSRPLVGRLAELTGRARGAGLDRVVLAGTDGSTVAAEAVARSAGAPLTVLDTTDPHRVAAVLADHPDRTLVVLSVKEETVGTDALRRVFEETFRAAGVPDRELARRFVVLADLGTPAADLAEKAGYPVVPGAPDVGGRFAALSAFGLAPAALAGADVTLLLDAAAALLPTLQQPYDNPALALGAALGASALGGRDKLVLADQGSGLPGLADWVEQVVAESTGKDGKGILPVIVEGVAAPGFALTGDMRRVILGSRPDEPGPAREAGVSVAGPLGAQFLLWQYAVAVAGRVLGVNPFDQPEVRESEDNTAALLRSAEGEAPTVIHGAPAVVDDAVEVHGPAELFRGVQSLSDAMDRLVERVPEHGYLAVMAYLDPVGDAGAAEARALLAARAARLRRQPPPVTFGWGPRLLHTTGQYHKGGRQNGAFLQITGETTTDLPVPGRPYTLGQLQLAQAFGDLRALRARGRPAVRLHLRDRAAGVEQLRSALT
ncbi:glucose-6-phosphate isomerase [Actinomadura kijaniata]|uniref:glucose-6-phosphate isomerase n=1 Tax=Actinomadura kijaniata TaxID=46161 RepID=UPI0008339DA7|nr:glucose-6-phosphate isomerase [Actinomadura kijaniata]